MHVGAFPATLLVSIDVAPAGAYRRENAGDSNRLLAAMLEKRRIPAVWRLARPAAAAEAPWLLGVRSAHEMALLLDDHWAGPSASRSGFAKELSWRLAAAKASGIEITTVASTLVLPMHRLEALARHHLTVVCDDSSAAGRAVRWTPLRHGIWRAPVSVALPRQRGLFATSAVLLCRRVIDQAIKHGQLAHLQIDAAALANNVGQAAALDQVLSHAARLRDQGTLAIDTPRGLLEASKRAGASQRSRSIMRVA